MDSRVRVAGDVRGGSKADMNRSNRDVRFTPKSGHRWAWSLCPLCAKSKLMHCNKQLPIRSAMASKYNRPERVSRMH